MDAPLLVNPEADVLGKQHAIFTGSARRYQTPEVRGVLSIKRVLAGEATWCVSGRRFTVRSTSWLLLTEGQPYSLEIEAATPATTFCLFFRDAFVPDVANNLSQSEETLLEQHRRLHGRELRPGLRAASNRLFSSLDHLKNAIASGHTFDWTGGVVQSALALLDDEAAEWEMGRRLMFAKAATRDEVRCRVQRGVDFMLSNLPVKLSTLAIAREAGLSEFHFHRSFRTLYRQTPHLFLQRQRLQLAAALLRDTKLPVTEVCAQAGFQSLGSFGSLFTRTFGISPRLYRQDRSSPTDFQL